MEPKNKWHRWSVKEVITGSIGVVITIALAIAAIYFRDEITDMENVSRYGLVGVFLIAFVAGSTFSVTALPVPYWLVTFMTPTVLAPQYGIWSPVFIGLLSGLGASLGQFLTFMIGYGGRSLGQKVTERFSNDIYDKAVKWIKKYGAWAIFFMSVLVNPLHLPMTIAIATLKYPPHKFFLFTFLGVTLKSFVLAFAGYFGLTWLYESITGMGLSSHAIITVASIAAAGIVGGAGLWQLLVWYEEIRDKNRKYQAAVASAKSSGKPLLVGNPWGVKPYRRWLSFPAHGSGDVCLDIDHEALKGQSGAVVASITHLPFADKSFGAAFFSHVLEHLSTTNDAKQALEEMQRVADTIFIAYPSKQSIGGWIVRDHHLWIWQDNQYTYVQQRGRTANREKVVVETPHNAT